MSRRSTSALVVAGLVWALGGAPSWGEPPNPTASDAGNNTAGGTDALVNTVPNSTDNTGFHNTAFGAQALTTNTVGNNNTAVGALALQSNIEGTNNTGVGPGALFVTPWATTIPPSESWRSKATPRGTSTSASDATPW